MISSNAQEMLKQGKEIFRFDTFGDEAFWGDALRLHQAIAGEKQGGVGPGVSPKTALAVGLKVDLDALPASLVDQLKAGKVNLDDPATTLALLKLNSVVGVTGHFDKQGKLVSMGIQCALCHSTVDDALVPGIGHRLQVNLLHVAFNLKGMNWGGPKGQRRPAKTLLDSPIEVD
jgi:hypothetical protein